MYILKYPTFLSTQIVSIIIYSGYTGRGAETYSRQNDSSFVHGHTEPSRSVSEVTSIVSTHRPTSSTNRSKGTYDPVAIPVRRLKF